jgi:LCP family protein required for cell wall assembly
MPAGRHSEAGTPSLKGFRRRWPRRILIGTNVVVAVILVVTGAAYGYVQFQFAQITKIHIPDLFREGSTSQSEAQSGSNIPPFTLLAVGSDSRNIAGGSQYQGSGASYVTGARSDSIVLLRVNPADRAIALLSIPRDSLVPIPGQGVTRINEAFNAGNAQLLVTVLQQDYGIQVNHYAEANFDTFQQLANAVGGVDIWFPAGGMDAYSLFKVGPGCNNLTGSLALAFVRSREYEYQVPGGGYQYQLLPESDLARIQRQQAFVKLALQKARKIAPTNITALNSLVSSVTSNLTLDSTFSNSELLRLADTFRSANLSDIPQFIYPTTNSTTVAGALDPNYTAGAKVIKQWLDVGQPAPRPSAASATPSTSPATTVVAPSSVQVEVANGSGVTGQAAQAAQDLQGLGYQTTVSSVRYYPTQRKDLVLYAPDSRTDATQVQSELAGGATLEEDSALTQSPYNLEVVTGTSFAGMTGAAPSAATTTSPQSTSTTVPNPAITGSPTIQPDSSSYVDGQYIPPGLQPGQPIGHCPN